MEKGPVDRLLTEDEVAEFCRTNKSTVRYWRQIGKLKSIKPGRHPLIRQSELERFLNSASET